MPVEGKKYAYTSHVRSKEERVGEYDLLLGCASGISRLRFSDGVSETTCTDVLTKVIRVGDASRSRETAALHLEDFVSQDHRTDQ